MSNFDERNDNLGGNRRNEGDLGFHFLEAYELPENDAGFEAQFEPEIELEPTREEIPENQIYFIQNAHKSQSVLKSVKPRRRRFKGLVAVACAAVIFFAGIGIGVTVKEIEIALLSRMAGPSYDVEAFVPEALVTRSSSSAPSAFVADFVAALEPAKGSVVNITTAVQVGQGFFGRGQESLGGGTGVMFEEDESRIFIVTNHHVVDGARNVEVFFDGNGPFSASLVGRNAENDIAVISIEKSDLANAGLSRVQLASFGDSDAMRIGDLVLAISNAPGEGLVVTDGIISTGLKQIVIEDKELTVLQTTAAINPGSSGGPLINMNGEVIGINTAKLLQGGNATVFGAVEGVGYSLPANLVKDIIRQLMRETERPMLGVRVENIEAEAEDGTTVRGIFIHEIIEGGGAEAAGLLSGDIIVEFGGRSDLNVSRLMDEISSREVGNTVTIVIIRDSEYVTIDAVLVADTTNSF